jgi:hypothetical protein
VGSTLIINKITKPGSAGDASAQSTLQTTDLQKVGTGNRDARIGKKLLLGLLQ